MRSNRVVCAFALAFALVPTVGAGAEPEAEARGLVDRYFAAYVAKDLNGFMALWSPKSPERAARKDVLKQLFAETKTIRLKEMTIVQTEVQAVKARVRVRVELEGEDVRSGQPHRDLGKINRVLHLVREDGAWRVWRYLSAELDLLERLLAADGADGRRKLYRDNKDLVDGDLVNAANHFCLRRAARGRFTEALRLSDLAFEIAEGLADKSMLAPCHYQRGSLLLRQARHAEALASFERALALFRQAKDATGEAAALDALGVVHKATGRYDEALRCYQDSLQVTRRLGDRTAEAALLGNIGVIYYSTGRYAKALQAYQEGLKIAREVGASEEEVTALGNIGVVFADTGRYSEALQHHRDCLRIRRERRDRAGEAAALNNLGAVYQATGLYAEALRHYHDSLKIKHELGDEEGEARQLGNIGGVYNFMGRYDEALRCCLVSLALQRRRGDRAGEAATLGNLGVLCEHTGYYREALRCHQDSLRIKRELGDRAGQAVTLNNLGLVHQSAGRLAEALRSYQDSLIIARELGDQTGEAIALGNIGFVHKSTGRYVEALTNYEAGRKLAELLGDSTTALCCCWGIGDVHRERKEWEKAAIAYQQAIERVEQLRGGAREGSLQTSFLAEHTAPYHGLVVCLLELRRPAEAFAAGERAKARSLIDVLQKGKADDHKGMTAEQRRWEQQLQERVSALTVELEALRGRKADRRRQDVLAGELTQRGQNYEAFRRDLFLRLPDLRDRRGEFTPATLTDLNRSLFAAHPKLAVLSYLVTDKETLLFVLTGGDKLDGPARLAGHRIEIEEKELTASVAQFRGACQKPGGGTPDGSELYRLLLAPIEEKLAGASHVILVPDGVLHTLPFHALKDGEEGSYLIQRCAVSYAPSATALLKMAESGRRRRHANAAGLLAAGIGDFGRRERLLPNAEPEAKAVAALFVEQSRTLLGREATKAGLRSAWAGRRYLHLATHGRLNEDVPLYSALVLSPSEGGRDEGLLFGRDLLEEELSAELVVLSACETGLGKRQRGEGILGMTWAWFVAGVPATVASQWSVADDSTARLMQVFYTELKGGAPKAEALRRAQLALLKDRKTRHPFYWAPFALTGDPW